MGFLSQRKRNGPIWNIGRVRIRKKFDRRNFFLGALAFSGHFSMRWIMKRDQWTMKEDGDELFTVLRYMNGGSISSYIR
jgi:hypothetical protein